MPNTQPDDLLAREITPEDAEAAAQLSEELGYPVSPAEMKQRIEAVARLPDHAIYVACVAGTVFGWIDVGICRHLQSEPRAEIGGLVVSSEVRGRGVGRHLITCAESWARQRGLGEWPCVRRSRARKLTTSTFGKDTRGRKSPRYSRRHWEGQATLQFQLPCL